MRAVILTGAGISAESGLKTFRDQGGLWEGHAVEDVATPKNLLHMHGELSKARCLACGRTVAWLGDLVHGPPCPACREPRLRPDIVWFGEVPHHMTSIVEALRRCELFAAVGTSGLVYPAADFVAIAARSGAHTLELNLEASQATRLFDESRQGPATQTVPAWVASLLG